MGKREQNKETNKAIILDAAKEVFAEKGYHNASISDILRKTSLARGTFYLYFQNKESIFEELVQILYMEMITEIKSFQKAAVQVPTSYSETLISTVSSLFWSMEKHRALVKIFLNSTSEIDPVFDKIIETYMKKLQDTVRSILLLYYRKKNLSERQIQLFTHLIFGGFKEIVYQWLVKEKYKFSVEKEIAEVINFYARELPIS